MRTALKHLEGPPAIAFSAGAMIRIKASRRKSFPFRFVEVITVSDSPSAEDHGRLSPNVS
jgi:hypothetical protein